MTFRRSRFALLFLAGPAFAQVPPLLAPVPAPMSATASAGGKKSNYESPTFVFSLLPKAFQKRPLLDFNVITEMTPEGRKVAPPSPANPVYYVEQPGKFLQVGSAPPANEHAPRVDDLEQAMQKALAASGYLPAVPPEHEPALLVVFNFGSHSIDPPIPTEMLDQNMPLPVTADELLPIIVGDGNLTRDLIERAALVGGVAFAGELQQALGGEADNMRQNRDTNDRPHVPVNPELGSPFKMFVMAARNNTLTQHLVEDAFHSCYFAVASAYDYAAVGQHERRLLWRTKMTVDAEGVNMQETLVPLIVSAGPYFGRDMKEVTVLSKRISREGRVEIGTPTVVEDNAPATDAKPVTSKATTKP